MFGSGKRYGKTSCPRYIIKSFETIEGMVSQKGGRKSKKMQTTDACDTFFNLRSKGKFKDKEWISAQMPVSQIDQNNILTPNKCEAS